MKTFRLILITFWLGFLISCHNPSEVDNTITEKIRTEFQNGNFINVKTLTDSLKRASGNASYIFELDSLVQISDRILHDFSFSEDEISALLIEKTGAYSDEDKTGWENKNWLEFRIINGEKRYFNRAASNTVLMKRFFSDSNEYDSLTANDPGLKFMVRHTGEIISKTESNPHPVLPVEMTINYTLTVNADAVPEGEIIRCWLPLPVGNHPRQERFNLICTSDSNYFISPDTAIHRTIYMEAKAVKGVATVFNIKYDYCSSGQYFDPETLQSKPETKTDREVYKKYTVEQLPHINFSKDVKRLADSLAGDSKDQFGIVRAFFYWFNENIPWAGALEYSTMPDIPAYVLKNKRGDCGMKTFLLISMLRYKGIPARWQSGWTVQPGEENLHDWCEIYYPGRGWIPADVTSGLQNSDDVRIKEFYLSGIDSYRMIVNKGVAGRLYPAKRYLRSEPFDFQRGEVEWEGGNIYFDKWDYNMEISYR